MINSRKSVRCLVFIVNRIQEIFDKIETHKMIFIIFLCKYEKKLTHSPISILFIHHSKKNMNQKTYQMTPFLRDGQVISLQEKTTGKFLEIKDSGVRLTAERSIHTKLMAYEIQNEFGNRCCALVSYSQPRYCISVSRDCSLQTVLKTSFNRNDIPESCVFEPVRIQPSTSEPFYVSFRCHLSVWSQHQHMMKLNTETGELVTVESTLVHEPVLFSILPTKEFVLDEDDEKTEVKVEVKTDVKTEGSKALSSSSASASEPVKCPSCPDSPTSYIESLGQNWYLLTGAFIVLSLVVLGIYLAIHGRKAAGTCSLSNRNAKSMDHMDSLPSFSLYRVSNVNY